MKKYLLSLFALLACMALFPSCEEDIEKRQVTFTAAMPADDLSSSRPGSIINGVPTAEGFNLSAQWKDGDRIQIFVRQDGIVYQADSPSTISDISSDGKTCSFMVTLPKYVNRDKDYDIIGVTGIEAYIDGEDVIASCTMKRVGIDGNDSPILPMWFTTKKGSNQAKFRHLCAYEVLCVNNNSDSSIRFKHTGFNVMTPWYKYSDKVVLTNSSRYETINDAQTDAESNEITIQAWETGTIVTWYIPRFDINDISSGEIDATIDNAKLKALVNGNAVTTTDALKSLKTFARGSAYYMWVAWDGSNLWFPNELCPDGNHPHMIDLGLPSGTKWACCNVGANSPAECGGYFAWGETVSKTIFEFNNYKWFEGGDNHKITKYCCNSDYGTVDDRLELEPEDDAAYVNWGAEWRMPLLRQIRELLNNCTSEWTTVNGISGYLFRSNTNNGAVFFPADGWRGTKGVVYGFGEAGAYWSRDYNYDEIPDRACSLAFYYGNMGYLMPSYLGRQWGANVRAVYVAQD